MLPEAHISHSTIRRFRVKIPSKKGDTTFFSHLKGILTRYEGIERLETNAVTGSVLFIHTMDSGKIVAYAESSGLFKIRSSASHPTIFSRGISDTFRNLNKGVTAFTGGSASIPDIVFLTLMGFGIYQISQGNLIAPAWYVAFWYALNIFLKSQPLQAAAGE